MKLLTFQARRFWWRTHSKTLDEVEHDDVEDEMRDAVVVFLHAEAVDEADDRRPGVFKKTLKHVKWLANKRELKAVVLHSFTHLGGENAAPGFAQQFIHELSERLTSTGYVVKTTPFGHFCQWDLDVYGESLAKVWKEI
jgi:hypothetical protein